MEGPVCGPAVEISRLAFALPHLEPWAVLATRLVGLALGALMLAGGSVALSTGLHAGLDLAAVVSGALAVGALAARRSRFEVIASDQH